MRRFLPALLLLFTPLAFAQNQTIVTGTIADPSGIPYYPATVSACLSPATLYPMVAGQQVNNNPGTNYCFGPVSTASNGSFLMSLWGNALITCSPVCPSTQWLFTVVIPGPVAPVGFGPQQFTATITISGNSQDIGATLNAAGVSQLRPAGAATNATNLVGPGVITGSFSGTHTETGNVTFANINKTIFVDQQAGATADVKFANACAALPATGGILDARGFGATTQTFSATVSCGTKTKIVTMLFDSSTLFQPSTAALNMIQFEPGNIIKGFTFDCGSFSTTYSGNVLQTDTAASYLDGTKTTLEDITIGSEVSPGGSCAGDALGTGISLKANGNGVEFLDIRHIRQNGLLNQFLLDTTGGLAGFVSGNSFIDTEASNVQNVFNFNSHGGPIEGNLFSNIQGEKAQNGAQMFLFQTDNSANSRINDNLFMPVSAWDFTNWGTFSASNSIMFTNTFIGRFAGTCTGNCPGNSATDTSYNTLYNNHFAGSSTSLFLGGFNGMRLFTHSGGTGFRNDAVDINKQFNLFITASGLYQLDGVGVGTAAQFNPASVGVVTAGVGTGIFNGGGVQNNGGAVLNIPTAGANLVGDTTTQTLTGKTLTSPIINGSTGAGTLRASLHISDQGTACANGNIVLSAGWGTTAGTTAAAGQGQTCQFTFTSSGTGQAANPTITDTLPTALPSALVVCTAQMVGGTGANTLINQTSLSATAPVFTFGGTPTAGLTYFVVVRCGP